MATEPGTVANRLKLGDATWCLATLALSQAALAIIVDISVSMSREEKDQ